MSKVMTLYGQHSLSYRRYDGTWTVRHLPTKTYSRELASQILAAIEALPVPERTKAAVDRLSYRLLRAAHHK
jgi:hypothetical protein